MFPKITKSLKFFYGIASMAWDFPEFDFATNTHHHYKFLFFIKFF